MVQNDFCKNCGKKLPTNLREKVFTGSEGKKKFKIVVGYKICLLCDTYHELSRVEKVLEK